MGKVMKVFSAALGFVLLSVLFVSCASAPPTKESLLAEYEKAMAADYDSVTMKADISMTMSGSSGSGLKVADMTAMIDKSQDVQRVYFSGTMMNREYEAYVVGDDATIVLDDVPVSGTAEEFGLAEFTSLDALMGSQGYSSDALADNVESIEKEVVNGNAVYTIVLNTDAIVETAKEEGAMDLSALDSPPTGAQITCTVGKDGRVSNMTMLINFKGFDMDMVVDLYDYNSTVVSDAPGSNQGSGESALKKSGDVYVMTSEVTYNADGSELGKKTFTLDEHGNPTVVNEPLRESDGSLVNFDIEYEHDDDGWTTRQTYLDADGNVRGWYDVTNERDDQGRVVKQVSVSSAGDESVVTYEYYDTGDVKSVRTEGASGTVVTDEYDQSGYHTLQKREDDSGAVEDRFYWTKDEAGNPASNVVRTYRGDELMTWTSCTYVLDAAGNPVELRDAQTNGIVQSYEWTKIDNPSQYTRLFAMLKR